MNVLKKPLRKNLEITAERDKPTASPSNMSFEFEDNKNQFKDPDKARQAVESDYTKIDTFTGNLVHPELYVEEDDASMHARMDLRELLRERLETITKLEQLTDKQQNVLKRYGKAIVGVGEDSCFHTEKAQSREEQEGLFYKSLTPLIEDARKRFADTFESGIDILELSPRTVHMTEDGEITQAEFDFFPDRKRLTDEFNDTFTEADDFRITYYRQPEDQPRPSFHIYGYVDGDMENKVRLREGAERD